CSQTAQDWPLATSLSATRGRFPICVAATAFVTAWIICAAAQLGAFSLAIRNLFKQKIDRLIDDRDGTYRAYVVVYDKQAPDGFNPWSRHQLTKTNAHWTILRSY